MSLNFIKLDINIMNDSKIKQIRKMPGGSDMLVLWVGLLCLGMKSGRSGVVEIGEGIAYDADMLSIEFDIEKRTVELSLSVFKKFGMIEVFENGEIFLCNFEKHQELERIEMGKQKIRDRVKKHRDKQKLLSNCHDVTVTESLQPVTDTLRNVTVTPNVTECNDTDLDLDLDLDKDKTNTKNKNKEKEKYNASLDCSFFNDPDFKQSWDEWMAVRRSKKASFKDLAIKRAVLKVVRLSKNNKNLAMKILNKSSDSGWGDLYELKETKTTKSKQFGQQNIPQSETEEIIQWKFS